MTDLTIKNHGDYAERVFSCGHTLRAPMGYKLTKTFDATREYLQRFTDCEPCKKL